MAKNTGKKKKKLLCDIPFLLSLKMGIGEVSQMTGVPQRQIRYWQEKGVIDSLNESTNTTRRFDYYNIKRIISIQAYLDLQYDLEHASAKTDKELKPLSKAIKKYEKTLIDD